MSITILIHCSVLVLTTHRPPPTLPRLLPRTMVPHDTTTCHPLLCTFTEIYLSLGTGGRRHKFTRVFRQRHSTQHEASHECYGKEQRVTLLPLFSLFLGKGRNFQGGFDDHGRLLAVVAVTRWSLRCHTPRPQISTGLLFVSPVRFSSPMTRIGVIRAECRQ